MAFSDQYTLSQDAAFKNRVKVAVAVAAVANVGNANSARHALALRILNDVESFVTKFVAALVTDATVAASAPTGASLTDGQLQTATNTMLLNFVQ